MHTGTGSFLKKTSFLLCLILLLAAVPRIFLLIRAPEAEFYHNDGREYMELSHQLAQGNGFSLGYYRWHEVQPLDFKPGDLHTDLARTPLFPLLGAGLFFLPFDTDSSARVVSILLSLLAVYCVFLLGKEIAGPECGLWSALLFAVYPYSIYYATSWSTENLFLITVALAFLFLLKCMNGHYSALLWCGVFSALAALTRPTAILFILLIPGLLWMRFMVSGDPDWTCFREWRWYRPLPGRLWKSMGVFFLAFIVLMLPWTIRNRIAGGTWNPATYYDGYVFWLSNSKIMEETYRTLDKPEYTAVTDHAWQTEHAEHIAKLREKKLQGFIEVGQQWKAWGWQEIRENPGRFPYLLKERFFHYWRICPNLIMLSPAKIALMRIFFSCLFLLAAAGLFLKRKEFPVLVLLAPVFFGMVISIPFLFVLRYRYPFFAPYICVLGGIALLALNDFRRKKRQPAQKINFGCSGDKTPRSADVP